MKCLIIHPEDQSTTFLKQIYEPLKNKTVIEGDITKSELPIVAKEFQYQSQDILIS